MSTATLPTPAVPSSAPVKRTMTYNQLSSCPDMEEAFLPIYHAAKPYTMTSLERMYGLFKAIEYVVSAGIPGDIVECGVWKGGSSMVAALSLLHFGDASRTLHLFDTFEGMPPPGKDDIQYDNLSADDRAAAQNINDWSTVAHATLDDVRANLAMTGYPATKLRFVKGRVEHTLPEHGPAGIALLRLDTDWYESTKHEMTHLFPRLSRGGVLLVDDYGHWKGSKKAVDEHLAEHRVGMLLSRIDYTARMGIKP